MKKKTMAALALLLCAALQACSIPTGTTPREVITLGEVDGKRLERRHIQHHQLYPMSAEGFFRSTSYIENAYWLVDAKGEQTPLRHLPDDHYEKPYLTPVLGVAGSDLWVGMRLETVAYGEVGLRVEVFNGSRVVDSRTIPHVVRLARCAGCFEQLSSYAVRPDPGNAVLRFETPAGVVVYDVRSQRSR